MPIRIDITAYDTAVFDSNTIAARVQMSNYAGEEYKINFHSRIVRIKEISSIGHRLTDDIVLVVEGGRDFELDANNYDIYVEGVQFADGESLEAELARIVFGSPYVAP